MITLLGVPLISPLFHLTAVPCTHDGHLHYHRIAAMKYAWQNGLYFSRWLPDVAYGYGYPFFVYREPTPLYASLFPHLLGMPLPAAENLFYALTILASGWFMYLWVRDVFGSVAGIVSAMAYMSAPYLLVDALIRGNSPESLALPLFPLLMWIGRRWVLNGRYQAFLVGVFSLAFFSLSHNISLLLFTPFMLLYLVIVGWNQRLDWQTLAFRVLALFVLGLGMTLFYSGGALFELDSVTLEQSTTTRNNDFRFNFVTTGEVFGPVATEDPNLVNPDLNFRLGWVPVGLAVLGVVWGLGIKEWGSGIGDLGSGKNASVVDRQSEIVNERRLHVWGMLFATAVFLFMAFPLSRGLWENLPLIDFVQFPWRFVGRAALPVAFLAGVPFASGQTSVWKSSFLVVALGLLFVETVPNLYPALCHEETFPTINTVHNYERVTGLVGVDPEGSYFPRTVKKRPSASPLEANYLQNSFPERFLLPDGVTGELVRQTPLGATVVVEGNAPFTAVYQTFDFAGWQATVDGQAVPITPSEPEGLISFDVPAGSHTLSVKWGSTPLRSTLLGLSLFSLAGTAVVGFVLYEKREERRKRREERRDGQFVTWAVFGVAIVTIFLKFGVFDRVDTPLRQVGALNVPNSVAIQGSELLMSHVEISDRNNPADEIIEVRMAWTAVSHPTRNYQTNVWLEDEAGHLWSDKNTFRTRKYEDAPPTLAWQPGQWGWEIWEVEPLAGIPPGNYKLVMTLFDLETLEPVTLTGENGQILGPTAALMEIFISSPGEAQVLAPQYPLETAVPHTGLKLLGYNQDREVAQPGEAMLVTVFAERVSYEPVWPLSISLVDEAGEMQKEWSISILDSELWEDGQRYRGQRILNVPGGLESGTYQFMFQDEVALGTLEVNAPERIFDAPMFDTVVDVIFVHAEETAVASLAGYTLTTDSNHLNIEWVWQAQSEVDISYRVFVHLVDKSGQILAQSDGEPANWVRPTTSWAAGEYILDLHQLQRPADVALMELELRVGLYNPSNGVRLSSQSGEFLTFSPAE
ncbi:MAG: glycosyltransferase family 39 protein [Chloroflexota bacterium]